MEADASPSTTEPLSNKEVLGRISTDNKNGGCAGILLLFRAL